MQIGLIGAGNMARALARGWGGPVLCSDSGSGRARALAEELGGEACTNLQVAQRADVVVLCHKPHQLAAVAEEIGGSVRAVVSILGGIGLADLQLAYPRMPVMALMPNTPVEVRQGTMILAAPAGGAATAGWPEELAGAVLERFATLGSVIEVQETAFDAATALTGVTPAYYALIAEAQVDAGVRHGLRSELAARLVAESMGGSAALIAHRGHDTLAVRREVASPGGSTARGLDALERGGLRAALSSAMDAVLRPASRVAPPAERAGR
jgi:pyrroline-5-carboxylate reductase